MEIRRIAFQTFRLSYDQIDLITDPLTSNDFLKNFPKSNADLVIHSSSEYIGMDDPLGENGFTKIEPKNREKIIQLTSPGQYEVGGVMVRRGIRQNFFIIDDDMVRVVYMGGISKNVVVDKLGNLGDVDILILPIGDNEIFPSYEKLEQIIKKADPTYLIPCAYKEDGLTAEGNKLRELDDFIKNFGFTHVSHEKKFKFTGGVEQDNKSMEVIVLD